MELSLDPQFREIELADLEKAIKLATNYLDQRIVESEKGLYWKLDRDDTSSLSIYSGSAGILIYYLELYLNTGEKTYLETAEAAGDYLVNYLEEVDLDQTYSGINGVSYPNLQWVYNSGYTGIVYALMVLANYSIKPSYAGSAKKTLDHLLAIADSSEDGIYWVGEPGIFADGGITLILAYAGQHLDERYWQAADKAGKHILSQAIKVTENQVKFYGADPKYWDYLDNIEKGVPYEWPNFEYGSSGIAYLLYRLYQGTGDEDYLRAAQMTANYLKEIAVELGEDSSLMPYRFPDMTDKFYLGYCHGPVGSSRIFQLLALDQAGEPVYLETIQRLTKGIMSLGAPYKHSWGYWHSYNRCCGTAGFIEHYINLKKLNQGQYDEENLDHFFHESLAKLLSEMTYTADEKTGAWPQAWERVSPTKMAYDIGYYDGVAGIASSLLHAHSFLKGDLVKIYLPTEVQV